MVTPVGPKPETENNNLHSRTGDQGAIDPVRASAEAPAPDLVETLRAEGRHFRGEPDCVGPAVTLLVERAADTITALTAEVERLRAALLKVTDALNQGRIVPSGHGVSGMTIEAQMRASVYNGVPVWPIEEAREILDEVNARAALKEDRT